MDPLEKDERNDERRKMFVYDERKGRGFMYDEERKLYIVVDRHFLQANPDVATISKDLRPLMNLLPSGHLPFYPGQMLTSDLSYRPRTPEDHVTYELPPPSSHLSLLQPQLQPQYEEVRKFLREALGGRGAPYMVVRGEGVESLFEALLVLFPLVQRGNRRLYSEQYLRRKQVEEVSSARLVVVDLEDRTLRFPDLTPFQGQFPIQYRGLLHIRDPSQVIPILGSSPFIVALSLPFPSMSASELLGWILDWR